MVRGGLECTPGAIRAAPAPFGLSGGDVARCRPPGRLHAGDPAAPHRGRVLGPRLDVQAIAGAQPEVAVPGVEDDVTSPAHQDLVVGVVVPVEAVPRTVRPGPGGEARCPEPPLQVREVLPPGSGGDPGSHQITPCSRRALSSSGDSPSSPYTSSLAAPRGNPGCRTLPGVRDSLGCTSGRTRSPSSSSGTWIRVPRDRYWRS